MLAPVPSLLHRHDDRGVVTLTLASPASRNALGLAMIEGLIDVLADIEADASARVVVLTGEGPALSSGHDLKEIRAHRNDADRGAAYDAALIERCSALMRRIAQLSKPVIAAVEGVATAAGCQLVASCDLAIAGEKARFALPGVNIGLFCSTPLVAVGRAISRKAAMEMALTGELFDAAWAERQGLVNRVVPAGQALDQALALAKSIAERSSATIAMGKRSFRRQIEASLSDAYAIAGEAMIENLAHPDAIEGIGAFLDKKTPQWKTASDSPDERHGGARNIVP